MNTRDRKAPFVRSSLMQAAVRRCDGANKNCSRTHRPHQLLRGIQASTGRFFTIVAEPYPRSLCRRLVAAYTQAIDINRGDHILPRLWSGIVDGKEDQVNKDFGPQDHTGTCKFGARVCVCAEKCVVNTPLGTKNEVLKSAELPLADASVGWSDEAGDSPHRGFLYVPTELPLADASVGWTDGAGDYHHRGSRHSEITGGCKGVDGGTRRTTPVKAAAKQQQSG